MDVIDKIDHLIVTEAIKSGWISNCIPISIIFHEILDIKKIKNTLCEGYANIDYGGDNKYAMWHCWIEIKNIVYDLAAPILKEIYPEYKNMSKNATTIMSKKVISGYARNDMDTRDEIVMLVKNIKLMQLYSQDPKAYWDESRNAILGAKDIDVTIDWMKKFKNTILEQLDS